MTEAAVTPESDMGAEPMNPFAVAVLGFLVAGYTAVFATLTWRHQSNFGTFGFDHGFFDQEIWLATHFHRTFVTIGGIDMWANHVNPVIYLLAPFYWIGAGPHFLYMVHTLGFALAAVPIWLIGREKMGDWLALGPALAWVLYPSIQWVNWWHFHPESLAVLPLLFSWYFACKKKWLLYAACIAVVLATKEDAALTVLALGFVVSLRYSRKAGWWTIGVSLVWFVVCMKLITPLARGTGEPFYANRFLAFGDTTNEIAFNMIRHPSRSIELIFARDRYSYYLKMFAPIGLIALLDPVVMLIAVPALLVNVISSWPYAHEIKYQYQISVAVGLFLALVEGIGGRRKLPTRRFLVGALCACALAANVAWSPSPLSATTFNSGIWAKSASLHTKAMQHAVELVPRHAGVAASYSIVPHMSHRTQIYEYPNPWVRMSYAPGYDTVFQDPNRVDYLVLDLGLNKEQKPLLRRLTRTGGEFEVLYDHEDVLVAKRTRPGHDAGLRRD